MLLRLRSQVALLFLFDLTSFHSLKLLFLCFGADTGVSVKELYYDMVVQKVKATAPTSSSGIDQGSLKLPPVPDVKAPDIVPELQQSLLFPLLLEVISIFVLHLLFFCVVVNNPCQLILDCSSVSM